MAEGVLVLSHVVRDTGFLCLCTDPSWSFSISFLCCLPFFLLISFSSLHMKESHPFVWIMSCKYFPSYIMCLLNFFTGFFVLFCLFYHEKVFTSLLQSDTAGFHSQPRCRSQVSGAGSNPDMNPTDSLPEVQPLFYK